MSASAQGRHQAPIPGKPGEAANHRADACACPTRRRARGCLLGQLAGDALGALVEFNHPERIRDTYPTGVRHMTHGGTWNTIAGQPTDDSEMALALARSIVAHGCYDVEAVRRAYIAWLDSSPFDCGWTIRSGLQGDLLTTSQANGALMRISPLGIYGWSQPADTVATWAKQDAAITHPHRVCQEANALFAAAIAHAIRTGCAPGALYELILSWADAWDVEPNLRDTVRAAVDAPPADVLLHQGWVLVALGNALWQLSHAPSLEDAISDTILRGGDTDTNAAICGALLGAVYGSEAIPEPWVSTLLACRPETGRTDVRHPRPPCYWPIDALELADGLVAAGEQERARK